ncbi:DUF397 domain-containing protein [Nonomuraea muscovyensis]|uniref:DUF397 domain-containing protein n=1 Tax=Nonomuraea muscovyensis TaxID=1124761 RepID=UPI001612C8F1|nr:DUF397 domain-containing protein [Nonomuraea muscovyensis]
MDSLSWELATAEWRKATPSQTTDNCVEVADLSSGRRGVRNSRNRTGPVLVFTSSEWKAFIEGVKDGEFD